MHLNEMSRTGIQMGHYLTICFGVSHLLWKINVLAHMGKKWKKASSNCLDAMFRIHVACMKTIKLERDHKLQPLSSNIRLYAKWTIMSFVFSAKETGAIF